MKLLRASIIAAVTVCAFTACTEQVKTSVRVDASTAAAIIYSCTYYSGYDDLATCQSTSHASCTSTYETFPSGGLANCFFPVAGYEACLITPPTWDWIYTTYGSWCDTGTVDGSSQKIYSQSRSVVDCSSTICACENPQTLAHTCSGAADCGIYSPNALTVSPTPGPCP